MTALIALIAAAVVAFAVSFRYGSLRVSELPALLLALLAGGDERERLRLILSHRDRRRLSITADEVGIRIAGVRGDRSKPHGLLVVTRTARECDCDACGMPLGIYHFRSPDRGDAYCFPCRQQEQEQRSNLRWERPS